MYGSRSRKPSYETRIPEPRYGTDNYSTGTAYSPEMHVYMASRRAERPVNIRRIQL